eukprot:CCRYP_020712-RA/>CCRYP_020712-RA protein AED:0.37 eAED:0.37 QI:0/-1/0/1/-1/0/1/0/91
MTIDIKDFYLNAPMEQPEFMCLKLSDMPDNITEHYKLQSRATPDSYVYVLVWKDMYGLPQADIIVQQPLETRLVAERYHQSNATPCYSKHD